MTDIPANVDGFAHVVMVPNYLTYNPGESKFKVIGETETHYVIETEPGFDGIKRPSAIEKSKCIVKDDKVVIIEGEIR